MKRNTSRVRLYPLKMPERRRLVADWAGLSEEDLSLLDRGLTAEAAEGMVENVLGVTGLPLGVATNFLVNGQERLVPMAIEEPSVIAAASHGAKLLRSSGGIQATASEPVMTGQIQLLDSPDPEVAAERIRAASDELCRVVDGLHETIVRLGGGARGLEVRLLEHPLTGPMVLVHLHLDVRDAMGANAVNTACEALAPQLEALSGGRAVLRILTNLAERRLARARGVVRAAELGEAAEGIVVAQALAEADPYRAATHNKGIMNGLDAVAVATGNDWRALEAGAHAYAARSGAYRPLSRWRLNQAGDLEGELELPLAVGTVGGATRAHSGARVALRILGVQGARELAELMAAVGLAQNLAALRALAAEGIQRGHMALHARSLAIAAGARGEEAKAIAQRMVREGRIRPERAQELQALAQRQPSKGEKRL